MDIWSFFSAHFIHKNRMGEDAIGAEMIDELHAETLAYYRDCKTRFGNKIAVVCAFDANVTLPTHVPGLTGGTILAPEVA